jgi:lipoprotein signal peptidase
MHYLIIVLFIYSGIFLFFPQQVLALTILAAAAIMNVIDWTTVPWQPF